MKSWIVWELMDRSESERSDRTLRIEDWREETEEWRVENATLAWWREEIWERRSNLASLISSAKLASDIPSKRDLIQQHDLALVFESLSLLSVWFGPVRKFITEMIGEIGLKHFEFLLEIVLVLITVLSDATLAVARQAITCGIELFRLILEKVAIQARIKELAQQLQQIQLSNSNQMQRSHAP